MYHKVRAKFVCGKCFGNDGLVDYCLDYAQRRKCDFCGVTAKSLVAAPVGDVLDHVRTCVFKLYDDPANAGLVYESAEGGYQGVTYDTEEIFELMELDFTRDKTDTLRDLVAARLDNVLWSDAKPYTLSPRQQLDFSWDHFCEIIKHKRRYFFLQERADPAGSEYEEIYTPAGILEKIFQYAEDVSAFIEMPANTRLYRARFQPRGSKFETAGTLGPPPQKVAFQTNRMSPPGVVMTYASEDLKTALAETVSDPGIYAIGEFVTERDALILDLTQIPKTPSIFWEIPDSMPFDPRPRIGFLNNISWEISRPIARDNRVHIEYVPTQVVTEYVRSMVKVDGRSVDGIRYRSSRIPAKTAVVLFADRDNLVLEPSERADFYHMHRDRWLRLDKSSVKRVRKPRS